MSYSRLFLQRIFRIDLNTSSKIRCLPNEAWQVLRLFRVGKKSVNQKGRKHQLKACQISDRRKTEELRTW